MGALALTNEISFGAAEQIVEALAPGTIDHCSAAWLIGGGVGFAVSMVLPPGGGVVRAGAKAATTVAKSTSGIARTAEAGLTTDAARKAILDAAKPLRQNGDSVVYLRTNPKTQNIYVGKSKNAETYKKRQNAHNKKLRKITGDSSAYYDFDILARPSGYSETKRTEEYLIRVGGGPNSINNPHNVLENKIYASSEKKYDELGGDF